MSIFKKFGVIVSLILIAIGIFFFAFRSQVTQFAALAAGLVILIIGGYDIIVSLATWKQNRPVANLIAGIVFFIGGIYLLLNSNITVIITGFLIGALAFCAGLDRFRAAFLLFRAKAGGGFALFSGLVHVVFGGIMCAAPMYGVETLVMIAGIYLFTAGILMLFSSLKFKDL